MKEKEIIRRQALEARLNINPDLRRVFERTIQEHFFQLDCTRHAQNVALYRAMRGEAHCQGMFRALQSQNIHISFPAVVGDDLVFREYKGEEHMTPGYANIAEPNETCRNVKPGVIVVPLLAFDESCNRLGYGQGHYDRVLLNDRRTSQGITAIGIAFECQKFAELPCETHDQRLDYIITEDQTYSMKA